MPNSGAPARATPTAGHVPAQLFASLFEQSDQIAVVLDAQGRVCEANSQCLATLGSRREHMQGQVFHEGAWLPQPLHEPMRLLLQQAGEGTSGSIELKLLTPSGEERIVLCHALPVTLDDATYVALTGVDITARKAWERRLTELTRQLQDSNAELEQFAYVASHDLRQPLRMIRSYIQMLERRLNDKLDDDTRQMMHYASDGAIRLDQMLVSLLEYSRVGRKGEPMAPLDSRAALDEALRFLEPSIREQGACITVSGEWPELVASRDEFTRLFQNLIDNAIKYHAPDRPPEIGIAVAPTPDAWQFCVTDNGIGIDPAQFDRLFRVFQRLQTRDKYEGSGIGLAVARKIVERHGGRIWVESDGPDRGCHFCFSLPRAGGCTQSRQ